MEKMPGAMFIIDTRREHIAVKEARKLGVPTIALIDTDSDPDLIDLPIPGNDDAMRAVEIICSQLADAVIEGKSGRADQKTAGNEQAGEPRRRSARSQFRAEGADDAAAPAAPAAEGAPVEAAAAEPVAAAG
jgi:small subunit ribosomal protein S2